MRAFHRRDLFKLGLGAPIIAAAVPEVSARTPGAVLTLDPKVVRNDLVILSDDSGQLFRLTVINSPWPTAGQRIAFAFGDLSFVGVVQRTRHELLCKDRFQCEVEGLVEGGVTGQVTAARR